MGDRRGGRASSGNPKPFRDQPYGVYVIGWGARLKPECATTATIDLDHSPSTESVRVPDGASVPFVAGYAVAETSAEVSNGTINGTTVDTFNQDGKPTPLAFDVAVIC